MTHMEQKSATETSVDAQQMIERKARLVSDNLLRGEAFADWAKRDFAPLERAEDDNVVPLHGPVVSDALGVDLEAMGDGDIAAWPSRFKSDLERAKKNSEKDKRIVLDVNSPGGLIGPGTEMGSYIDDARADGYHVEARIRGVAYSQASWLTSKADTVRIEEAGRMMIHLPQSGATGYGNYRELREFAAEVLKIADGLEELGRVDSNVYVRKTGKSLDEIMPDLEATKWLSSREAVEYGLADEVIEPPPIREVDSDRTACDILQDMSASMERVNPSTIRSELFRSLFDTEEKVN